MANNGGLSLTLQQLTELLGTVSPVPMGDWQSSVIYNKLNIVKYNGTTYIAKKSNQNYPPETTSGWQEVWMAIADKGGTGDTGLTPNISMSATVGNTVGTPSVSITKGGTAENPTFLLNFNNLKGETGATGASSINSALVTNVDGDSEVNTFSQKYIKGDAQAKNYYNLGAYDTFVSNGDGTGTITRRTGFKSPSELLQLRWSYEPQFKRFHTNISIKDSKNDTHSIVFNNFGLPLFIFNDAPPNGIAFYTSGSLYMAYHEYDGDLQGFLDNIISNLYIQYELASEYQYTRKVIENQPIHIANQDEELYYHTQFKKLNLFNGYLEQGSFNALTGEVSGSDASRLRTAQFVSLFAGTYTVSASSPVNNIVVYIYSESEEFLQRESFTVWQTNPFTFTISGNKKVKFGFKRSDDAPITPSNVSNVILVRGTSPYLPNLINQNDISLFTTTGQNPAELFGGDWEELGTLTVGTTTLHVYQKVSGGN